MAITDLLKQVAPAIKTNLPAALPPNIPVLGPGNPNPSTGEQIRAGIQASAPQEAKAPTPIAYAHDPTYEHAVNTINSERANLGSGRTTGLQRLGEDFDTAERTAGTQNETNLSSLQNKLANQGINWSGINVAEQGRIGQNFQEVLSALTKGRTRGTQDIESAYTTGMAGLQNRLTQAEIDRADRQTDRENEAAANAAQADAAKNTGDSNREFLNGIVDTITRSVQPVPQPTGQMAPPPRQVVQQALAQIPPPAKTPQQQIQDIGVDPRQLQTLLQQAGYDPGPIDGVIGIKTQRALAQWKQSINLPATADINPQILGQLQNWQMAGMNMGGTYKTKSGQQA